ncbi:MAG: hypothetical protein ACLR7Q_09645 [Eubacterium sp.]
MGYDISTSSYILNSLAGFSGLDFRGELAELDDDLVNNFYLELEETLKSGDYDSNTVVKESLENAGKEFFSGMNYQIKRGIENDFEALGKDETLNKWYERASDRDYKTASPEAIEQYVNFVEALDNVQFYY